MNKFILYTITAICCISCSSNDESGPNVYEDATPLESLFIDRVPKSIKKNEAINVAAIFAKGIPHTRGFLSDYDITEINDSTTNTTLLYIINFANDNGYVLVSANKNTMPILAYSEKGHFDLTNQNASWLYINEYKALVKNAQSCTTDSLRKKYALQWAVFEKTENNSTRALSSSEQTTVNNEIRYRESLGYKHLGSLSVARYYLPEENYQSLIAEMKDYCDSKYDYMNLIQVFIKSFSYETIGELLETNWHQRAPFNIDADNGLAGCVPIAIAQITYYHKYPKKYNWDKIYKIPEGNGDFYYFIKDIRDKCGVEYAEDGTGSTIEKAKKAILSLGYTGNIYSDAQSVLNSQLHKKNPVYMQGFDAAHGSKRNGHAWVCDGYKNVKYDAIATFIPNPSDNRFRLEEKSNYGFVACGVTLYPNNTIEGKSYGEYFHMNMGWGGSSNGWYRINTAVTSTDIPKYKYGQSVLTMEK